MSDAAFELALAVAALGYGLSVLLIGWRGLIGPNSLDRLVALDALVAIIQGGLAVYMVWTADTSVAYAMVAVALLGYLSSVSVARFRTPDARRPAATTDEDGGAGGSGGGGGGATSANPTGTASVASPASTPTGSATHATHKRAAVDGSAADAELRTENAARTRASDEADRTGLWKQEPGVRMPTKDDAQKSDARRSDARKDGRE